jgi:antitoxin ParD1/3/4
MTEAKAALRFHWVRPSAQQSMCPIDNSWKLLNGARMSKVITPHFEQLIEKCISSGRFNNKSEVIRAGLRLLEEHESKTATAKREDLSRVIQSALLDARPLIPASQLIRRRRR